jgi:hypothetical protein
VSRPRPVRVLFVPSARADGELPVELLRLATAIKLGTPHRVDVHDAEMDGTSLRTAAAVLRPVLAVVEQRAGHPARATQDAVALRHAGASVVAAWGEGPADPGVEFDLRLAPRDVGRLQAIADALGRGTTLLPPPASNSVGEPGLGAVDRKLLDYARYRRLGGWGLDGPASAVLLDPALRDPIRGLLHDLDACAVLGIRWCLLRGPEGAPAPSSELWSALAAALSRSPRRTECLLMADLRGADWRRVIPALAPALHALLPWADDDADDARAMCARLGVGWGPVPLPRLHLPALFHRVLGSLRR